MHHEPSKVIKVSFKWSCLSLWVNLKRKLNFTEGSNTNNRTTTSKENQFPYFTLSLLCVSVYSFVFSFIDYIVYTYPILLCSFSSSSSIISTHSPAESSQTTPPPLLTASHSCWWHEISFSTKILLISWGIGFAKNFERLMPAKCILLSIRILWEIEGIGNICELNCLVVE